MPHFGRKFLRLNYIYTKKHLYPQSNSCADIDGTKMWSSCGSTYCSCLARWVIRTLRRAVLERAAKPSHAAARPLGKVLGTLRTIFIKLD